MKKFNELWQSLQTLINLSMTASPTGNYAQSSDQIALTVASMYSIKNRSISHISNSKGNTFQYCSKACGNVSSWISRTDPLWSYHGQGLVLNFEDPEISFVCWPKPSQDLKEFPVPTKDVCGLKRRPYWCILMELESEKEVNWCQMAQVRCHIQLQGAHEEGGSSKIKMT